MLTPPFSHPIIALRLSLISELINLLFMNLIPQQANFSYCLPVNTQRLGPRHLAFHPNGKWLYAANELDSTITQYDYDSGNTGITKSKIFILPSGLAGEICR